MGWIISCLMTSFTILDHPHYVLVEDWSPSITPGQAFYLMCPSWSVSRPYTARPMEKTIHISLLKLGEVNVRMGNYLVVPVLYALDSQVGIIFYI